MVKKDDSKKTILVVEDEPDILDVLEIRLAKEGHGVLKATDGNEGLIKARNEKPWLIILDMCIPGIDGNELCRTIKSEEGLKHIKIIIFSAKAEEECIEEGLSAGADDYVTKPYTLENLLHRINKLT